MSTEGQSGRKEADARVEDSHQISVLKARKMWATAFTFNMNTTISTP